MQIHSLKSVCRIRKKSYFPATPETEAENVLNRPFYSEYQDGTLLESVTLTASEETDNAAVLPKMLELEDSMPCTVIYNGTSHSCTARKDTLDSMVFYFLRNPAIIGGDDTGKLQAAMNPATAVHLPAFPPVSGTPSGSMYAQKTHWSNFRMISIPTSEKLQIHPLKASS